MQQNRWLTVHHCATITLAFFYCYSAVEHYMKMQWGRTQRNLLNMQRVAQSSGLAQLSNYAAYESEQPFPHSHHTSSPFLHVGVGWKRLFRHIKAGILNHFHLYQVHKLDLAKKFLTEVCILCRSAGNLALFLHCFYIEAKLPGKSDQLN